MLLIGSRAIRVHFPEFREPVDWDLVGTRRDAERLAQILQPAPESSQRPGKAHFRHGEALVELAIVEEQPYWALVLEAFRDGPEAEDPVLGSMTVPPASFLMITKQCGLIYRIAHWHKNLADLYYLRNLIPEIPASVERLLPHAQADSRRMFARSHARVATEPLACHPKVPPHPRPDVHRRLHLACALGSAPLVDDPRAWNAFPQERPERRVELMTRLFAEEAMVLAGHQVIETARETALRTVDELRRFALRSLITSGLPEGWRYFGVNHYREIEASFDQDLLGRLAPLFSLRPSIPNACAEQQLPDLECVAPEEV